MESDDDAIRRLENRIKFGAEGILIGGGFALW